MTEPLAGARKGVLRGVLSSLGGAPHGVDTRLGGWEHHRERGRARCPWAEGARVAEVRLDRAEVQRAADRVGAAAATVESVGLDSAASDLAAAMPRSSSAAAARRLASAWSQDTARWVASARAQEQRLSASASATVATDQRSAQRLSHLTSRLGPVPQ